MPLFRKRILYQVLKNMREGHQVQNVRTHVCVEGGAHNGGRTVLQLLAPLQGNGPRVRKPFKRRLEVNLLAEPRRRAKTKEGLVAPGNVDLCRAPGQ